MVSVLYIEMSVFALSILLVVFMSIKYRAGGYLLDKKLFMAFVCLNASGLVFDVLTYMAGGKPGIIAKGIVYVLSPIGYILTTTSLVLWSLYARYQVYRDVKSTIKILPVLLVPACINALLAVLSCFNGYYFHIDEDNCYHRDKLFVFYAALCFAYILYTQIFVLMKYKQIIRKYFIPLAIFAVPPLVGGFLQTVFEGVTLVWIAMTVSVLIIYLNIQNNQLYTDDLTGLSNRRYLNRYLQECTRRVNRTNLLAGIMLDLDCFKQINDTWGHSIGDQALIYAGEILEMSFRKGDMICRFGGDEFIVIFEIEKESDLTRAVDRLKMNIKKFEEQNRTPYKINFSIGYDIYDLNSETNAQQFFNRLDSLMYENKRVKNNRESSIEYQLL